MTTATSTLSSRPSSRLPAGLSLESLKGEAWRRGSLGWLLRDYQRPIYEDIKTQLWGDGGYLHASGPQWRYILEIHRRFGKSFLCGVIAAELCRRKEGARVYWAAETAKQVGNIIAPNMRIILRDCPDRLKPRWYRQDGIWLWPGTEAEIHVAGCEDEMKADRLRGDGADLFILDEAGMFDTLQYVYRSIALWMTADRGGRILMPSSPAKTPGHPFTAYCMLAESGEGGYSHRSVHESQFTPEQIADLARECGGEDTSDWRREGLALRVIDESRAIVPEFSADGAEAAICMPECTRCGQHFDKHGDGEACEDGGTFAWMLERPEYADHYVSGDPGWYPDLYALLFGYHDFRRALTVVEDELEFSKPTTEDVATGVKAVETLRWGAYFERMRAERRPDMDRPHKRVSDINHQLVYDLRRLHELDFQHTRKDDADAQVNELRLQVKHRKLAIHPRCKRLRAHLKAGIKTKNGKDWERIEGFGHFDFVAALVYLVRNVDTQHNPYPDLRFATGPDQWVNPHAKAAAMTEVPERFRELAAAWPGVKGAK